jgi:putative ABC transport system substrate-binding protein
MKRRQFIALVGRAAASWPLAARAQQAGMPVIGFLSAGSAAERVDLLAAFRQGLSETDYVEGRNVVVDYRWADNQYDRLTELAADLVRRRVRVIVTPGSTPAALAAKAATTAIPIVFTSGADPVKLGLVASLSRPAGNLTGVTFLTSTLPAKQVELLHELVPRTAVIGFLVNPSFPDTPNQLSDVQAAANALRQELVIGRASAESDFESAFSILLQQKIGALLVQAEPFFFTRREQLAMLPIRYALPAMYQLREFVSAGGLISYGANLADTWRLAGVYCGRILKGEKPGDLPVQQSTKVELVINLKTAKALGLTVPPTLLSRADEVIE